MDSKIKSYLWNIPDHRRFRLMRLRKSFLNTMDGIHETLKYNMPTFEKNGNWVSIGNQKNYISVYFCNENLIRNIKTKFPNLDTGKGCVRIKDHQEIPIHEIVKSFKKAMEMSQLKHH